MNVRFYVDPETEAPHIHQHGVGEAEVIDVLTNPGEDRPVGKGRAWSSVKRERGVVFGSFTFPILNLIAYL